MAPKKAILVLHCIYSLRSPAVTGVFRSDARFEAATLPYSREQEDSCRRRSRLKAKARAFQEDGGRRERRERKQQKVEQREEKREAARLRLSSVLSLSGVSNSVLSSEPSSSGAPLLLLPS